MINQIKLLQQKLRQTHKRYGYYLKLHMKYPSDEKIKEEFERLSSEEYEIKEDIKKLKR